VTLCAKNIIFSRAICGAFAKLSPVIFKKRMSLVQRGVSYALEHPEQVVAGAEAAYNLGRAAYRGVRRARSRTRTRSPARGRARRAKSVPSAKKTYKMSMSGLGGQPKVKVVKKGRVVRAPKSIKDRVKKLEKKAKENFHYHCFKGSSNVRLTSAVNQCNYSFTALYSSAEFELMLGSLPYYNTAAPGTNVQTDTTLVSYNQKFKFDVYCKAVMRNNYLYPLDMDCYIITPRTDTTNTAIVDMQNSKTQQQDPSIYLYNNVDMFPTDYDIFTQKWKIVKHCKGRLQSGDEMTMPYAEPYTYDPKANDNNIGTYKPGHKYLMMRIQGVTCHDSVTNNIGLSPSAIDCLIYRKFNIKYPSLTGGRTYEVEAVGTAIANAAIVGVSSAEIENAL